ncbi:hypothetical protein [Litorimonas sp. WD9-15]|uniref:hypothetical protein n=1 Tax=Litorimonas sp. WD9-15 TaxID=3418716 RepID=UPI003D060ECB
MMTTSNVYEIFNDFLAFKDPTQVLDLATHLEVFGSATLSDGKVYTGEAAPEAFREAIRRHAETKKSSVKLGKISSRVGDDTAAIFVTEVKGKRTSQSSAFSITLRGSDMIGFVETVSA